MIVRPLATARGRRGTTLPVVTALLVTLVGMVAFAVDIGFIAARRTDLQRSADSSALAGSALLGTEPGKSADYAAARSEVKKFALLNEGLTVLDEDIAFGVYNPAAVLVPKFSTVLGSGVTPNAVQVTLRRDAKANEPLNLFFAPVIGRRSTAVRAQGVACVQNGYGVLPEAELLPYAIQEDYFHSAIGPTRPGVDTSKITDDFTVNPKAAPTNGGDGTKEIILFGSDKKGPGNFGSVDIGSDSNGTPDLVRQILNGASAADFADKDFASKVTDGALYAPNSFTGDTGLSVGVKAAFESIIGQKRIVPLYSTVSGNGNNAVFAITEFAGVVIVAVDLTGNPKKVIAQPTGIFSKKVTSAPPGAAAGAKKMNSVYAPPRLVIP